MKIDPDPWLSEILERPAFRVSSGSGEQRLAEHGFYFAKVPTTELKQLAALQQAGFQVVEVNITLDRKPVVEASHARPFTAISGVEVRNANDKDWPALLEIAERAFVYSRFHLDPKFPNHLADRIKRDWIQSYSIGKRGERTLVVLVDGTPAGFIAQLHLREDGKHIKVIDLMAVDARFQGRGLGRVLMDEFIRVNAKDCDLLRVGTQVANVPSLSLYTGSGFRISHSNYVLHAHRAQ